MCCNNYSPFYRAVFICCLLSNIIASSSPRDRELPSDIYLWQRVWSISLVDAITETSKLVRIWRVLGGEVDPQGKAFFPKIDWSVLAASARPIVLVIRIDGQLEQFDGSSLLQRIRELLSGPHRDAQVTGIEIDYDCATSKLSAYAGFLKKLKAEIGASIALSITGLPTWLSASALDDVLSQVDEIVLQVHAVQDPSVGLFSAKTALDWIKRIDRRTPKPFRVALPAYSSRVVWDSDGGLYAIESEAPKLIGEQGSTEIVADPREVAVLLRALRRDPPHHLAGLVWFRLPTSVDRRAWSLSTLQKVISGDDLESRVEALTRRGTAPGMKEIVLANRSYVDGRAPTAVLLPGDCSLGDGVNGYALDDTDTMLVLRRTDDRLLKANHERVIGWMRCATEHETLKVRF